MLSKKLRRRVMLAIHEPVAGMKLIEEVTAREDEAFVDTEAMLDSILLDAEVRQMMEM